MFFYKIKDFFTDEEGAETLEYAVIAGVIVLLGIIAYQNAGIQTLISTMFQTVLTEAEGLSASG